MIPARSRPYLRALVPPLLALACWRLDVPFGPWLLGVGLLGGVLVAREEVGAPIAPWRARFPGVSFRQVQRLPSPEDPHLREVCLAVQGALTQLAASGAPRAQRRRIRAELGGLVALAADLSCQVERLALVPDAELRRERILRPLRAIAPSARRLGDTLLRSSADGASPHLLRLDSLQSLQRELCAQQDCLDELAELTEMAEGA